MNSYSIEISNLGKTYKLYASSVRRLKEALDPFGRVFHSKFVALENVNLKIQKGETFALVGRNGAGKSTLLKALAGIVTPTSGEIKTTGRIVALLELGAGFNPEMSGRDNVFLFGAFHGFKSQEMAERYEDIVAFAEIGEFIHQPVRTYSSGMFVRLAFACSVHLQPDILIVDEALSVGDARFQLKCFKFIDGLKAKGTTIVLVSHDLTLIKMVSDRACLIDHGKLVMVGTPKDVANKYFDLNLENRKSTAEKSQDLAATVQRIGENQLKVVLGLPTFGDGAGKVQQVEITTSGRFPYIDSEDEVSFTVHSKWDVERITKVMNEGDFQDNIILGVSVADRYGNYVFGMTTIDKEYFIPVQTGEAKVTFKVNLPSLKSDDYIVNTSVAIGTQQHHTSIAWHEAFFVLEVRNSIKNIYGWMYQPYSVF